MIARLSSYNSNKRYKDKHRERYKIFVSICYYKRKIKELRQKLKEVK